MSALCCFLFYLVYTTLSTLCLSSSIDSSVPRMAPTEPPEASFLILQSVEDVRKWKASLNHGETIGFVPTMGALHNGHLALVRASLAANDHTVVSIFVNPAQFAPHEDLATYPRTIESDIAGLEACHLDLDSQEKSTSTMTSPTRRRVSALFLPPVDALYPSGITTEVSKQRGTFVEVKGLQEVMEGASRPGFFRGVATVVLKLFNIVMKDIQQALLLRRMLLDIHLLHPTASNLIIHPTYRDQHTDLALSSRNAYLTEEERPWARVLVDGLKKGQVEWNRQRKAGTGKNDDQRESVSVKEVLQVVRDSITRVEKEAKEKSVQVKLIYIALNDPVNLHDLEKNGSGQVLVGEGAVLSGAVMLGKTRLIDNIVFDYDLNPTVRLNA